MGKLKYFNDGPLLWRSFPFRQRFFLAYTLYCPARCAHCSVESSPGNNETMTKQKAFELIETSRAHGFRLLVLSGGEALHYFKDMQDIIEFSARLQYTVWVETNAFWASSLTSAREKVSLLKQAGVTQLVISTDLFHIPFVPIDNIIWAIQAAEKVGVGYHIDITRSFNPGADEELLVRLKDSGIEPGYWEPIPFGRGKSLPNDLFKQYRRSEIPGCDGLCLAIDPSGNCTCCCNFLIHRCKSGLGLGNIYEQDFATIIDRFLHSPYLCFIEKGGLRDVPLGPGDTVFTGTCDVCSKAFKDVQIVQWIDQRCAGSKIPLK